MLDSFGDGWNKASWVLQPATARGGVNTLVNTAGPYTLNSGSSATQSFTVPSVRAGTDGGVDDTMPVDPSSVDPSSVESSLRRSVPTFCVSKHAGDPLWETLKAISAVDPLSVLLGLVDAPAVLKVVLPTTDGHGIAPASLHPPQELTGIDRRYVLRYMHSLMYRHALARFPIPHSSHTATPTPHLQPSPLLTYSHPHSSHTAIPTPHIQPSPLLAHVRTLSHAHLLI
jgi:hypothetical protein